MSCSTARGYPPTRETGQPRVSAFGRHLPRSEQYGWCRVNDYGDGGEMISLIYSSSETPGIRRLDTDYKMPEKPEIPFFSVPVENKPFNRSVCQNKEKCIPPKGAKAPESRHFSPLSLCRLTRKGCRNANIRVVFPGRGSKIGF